jgi:predicted transcriptional regulator
MMFVRSRFDLSKQVKIDKKYRGHFEIMALILDAARDKYVTRFSMVKYSNTNYAQLKRYLRVLIEMRLIEVRVIDGRVLYKTSVEGIDFLERYYALLDIFSSFKGINEDAKVAGIHFTEQDSHYPRLNRLR